MILESLGVSPVHAHLFRVLALGVGLLVLVLALLNAFFYLDNREAALIVCGFFAASNVVGTITTLLIGPTAYGYGFVVAAGLTSGPDRGALAGFAIGVVADLVVVSPFGLTALAYTVVGWAVGSLRMVAVDPGGVHASITSALGGLASTHARSPRSCAGARARSGSPCTPT